jgi:hypothetical protein
VQHERRNRSSPPIWDVVATTAGDSQQPQ